MLTIQMPREQFPAQIQDPIKCAIQRDVSLRRSVISFAAIASSKGTYTRYSSDASTTADVFTPRSSTSSYTTVSSFANRHNHHAAYHFDETPTLVKTPWEADRSQRGIMARNKRPATGRGSLPIQNFRWLPDEVYNRIVRQVESVHFSDEAAGTCISCYRRDLCNLAMANHASYRAARQQLYGKIFLVPEAGSTDGPMTLPWHSIKLLRRTLRENPVIASYVRELHFPDAQLVYQEAETKERQAMIDSMASLVMAVPNLERFSGLYLTFDHTFDRLTHALSTRTRLKEKVWVLRRSDERIDDQGVYWANHDEFGQACNNDAFLRSHDNWKCLEMLCLFGQTTGRMDYRSFAATFRNLPSLSHLLISDFDSTQFTDRTLTTISSTVRSLRLQELPGLTERGLQRFLDSSTGRKLHSISLVKLEITSSVLISNIFSRCTDLKRFTLAQDISPTQPAGLQHVEENESGIVYASKSLEYLHWDIVGYGLSLQDLATAISANAFPSLRALRVPSDDCGFLQRVCAPSAALSDTLNARDEGSVEDQCTSPNPFEVMSLPTARRQAQQRKVEASKDPFISIVVSDEDGVVQHTYTLRSYMGTLSSQIQYCLEPDVVGSQDAIAGLNDLLLSRGLASSDGDARNNEEISCCDTSSEAGAAWQRASFESWTSHSASNVDAGNHATKALKARLALALARKKNIISSVISKENTRQQQGHRTKKMFVAPDMKVFF